ncbi:DUF1353 domain-containing protein [Mesorhizobium sp.]|uniref:DUF1353 domain-containing protein n=1 Tax=Mesorhizobium sp. TaxID=1871066 RepID=UPI000FE96555|nr:DUF1353 domain-containing protein [Mesorhizobium sp.]RWN27582.1 MAG: DUF1353 domain-containing protein [Mesorhizobium sp.]
MRFSAAYGFTGLAVGGVLLSWSGTAKAEFVGTLQLIPEGCQTGRYCKLGQEFGYVDPLGIGWQARKGLQTDGASIPPWARPLVGGAFEPAFIKAAIIHDHYCDRRVRPWRQTHRVFYNALLESGVESGKAGIMYFAVLVGGPKWAKLVKGKPCPVGQNCINALEVSASVPESALAIGTEGGLFVSRAPQYDTEHFAELMREKVPELEKQSATLTVEEVERQAAGAMAGDFYFVNGDEVGSELELEVK